METAIALTAFRELWIHTGTACNLSCPFCHEGSRPGDMRIGPLTLADIAPQLDLAATVGVERFAFTGGEPLIVKDILAILLHALRLRPALVLTNGTAPFIRRAHHLATLRAAPNALSFRVSIDYPDEARHDAGRGLKNFRKALDGLRLLHEAGFATGITRMQEAGEDSRAVHNRFRNLLRRNLLPEDLPIVALPELGSLEGDIPAPLPNAGTTPESSCARGRMVIKRDGKLRFTPCPLVDDDASMDMHEPLGAALAQVVVTRHRRCSACLGPGVNYVGDLQAPG
jgi:uncharacterized Fe-S cluster-containing radical SAM superfamily protein